MLNGLQARGWHDLPEIWGAVAGEVSAQQMWLMCIASAAEMRFCFWTRLFWQEELWTKRGAGKKGSAWWSGKAENLFFWSHFSEPFKIQNEAVNAKVAVQSPRGSRRHCASPWQVAPALRSFKWGGSPFPRQSFLLHKKRKTRKGRRGNLLENVETALEQELSWGTLTFSVVVVGVLLRMCF